ncbi:ComEC/Rec2 family competence protein [uncultured Dubosiella sp.]|uniref:ComEC/Rec2 family competence protein n=1 Tax=uncultured Dubosiella sp. TaxID=1937011 RepID=UPI0025B4C135|nr:MBL fold metallo-hydrolase [uncultured Dubosiella sp.]
MNAWLLVGLGVWLSAMLDPFYCLFFCGFASLYFAFRFPKTWTSALFLGLALLRLGFSCASVEAKPGEYTVYEVKANYALARNGRAKIVLYQVPTAAYGDRYAVQTLEPIQSLHNLSLFSFEAHMAKQGVELCARDPVLIAASNSVQARIFRSFQARDDPFLLGVLYGIAEKESFFATLGLPLVTLFCFGERWIRRRFGSSWSRPLTAFGVIGYGIFFFFHPALIRLALVQLTKWHTDDWRLAFAWPMIGYVLLRPAGALDLVLVVPVLWTWIHQKGWSGRNQKPVQLLALALLQVLFFSQLDLVALVLTGMFKKGYALLLIASLLPVSWPWLAWLKRLPDQTWLTWTIRSTIPFLACALIVEPFQKSAVLIDAGQNVFRDNVATVIVPFLRSRGIHRLDAVVVTHDDFDHSGGVEELQKQIPVRQIVTSRDERVDVDYPFVSLLPAREVQEENDESIVSYFSYDGIDYLWMGDAGVEIERQLLKQYDLSKVDVLKLGHHGSQTSSDFSFLAQTNPQLALISVGENNRYGHPHPRVIQDLRNLEIDTLMTKDDGMVHIFSLGRFCFVESAKGKIGMLDRG